MNSVFSLAFFLLSPFSFSHHTTVALQEKIVVADSSDVEHIFELSKQLPSLYAKDLKEAPSEPLAFRTRDIYQRLLKGEDIRANALKQKHTFLVFKDQKKSVQGYIHGWIDLKTNEAAIDELVVDEQWRKQKVAHALIKKLLAHFKTTNSSVIVTSRIPFSKEMFVKFGIEVRESDFDTIFIVDHLLSRFSIRYFMFQNRTVAPKHQAVANELHQIISEACAKDSFSIDEAMKHLANLADVMNQEIKVKAEKVGEEIYSGIQDDKYDVANVYFVMMVMSFLSNDYSLGETYLNEMIDEVREAQKEGGLFPVNLQFFIARVYAFIPFLNPKEKGAKVGSQWIQKSREAYQQLTELSDVILSSGHIEMRDREIEWLKNQNEEIISCSL